MGGTHAHTLSRGKQGGRIPGGKRGEIPASVRTLRWWRINIYKGCPRTLGGIVRSTLACISRATLRFTPLLLILFSPCLGNAALEGLLVFDLHGPCWASSRLERTVLGNGCIVGVVLLFEFLRKVG